MCHPERSASGVELLRVERQRTSKSARHKPSRIFYAIPEAFPTVDIYSYEQKVSVNHCRSQIVAIRPRSFAASPHAVILERSEESRGATPLEDDTGGGRKGRGKREKRNVGEDIILPQNNRPSPSIGRSMTKALY